jgi:3-hydroxyisobutyrate dehydrogenase
MAKLAFCGLGQMGVPMAIRLIEAGHDVTVWNRTTEKARPVVERGAGQAATPAEAAAGAEAAITMLATPRALDDVLFGGGGLAEGLAAGSTLIEMSTVGPTVVREIRSKLPPEIGMLDAPVQGSVPQVLEGSLRMWVGGPDDEARRWMPILEVLGTPRHVGPLGSGAGLKLVMNSTLGAALSGLGEALALGDGLGLDQGITLDALEGSPLGTTVKSKRPLIESGVYEPHFKVSLAHKDATLVTDEAARAGVDMRVAEAARQWYEGADEAGLSDLDYSAVVAHIRGRPARLP